MCRDTHQFLELLRPVYNDALRYCRAICASWSPADAEDVLQQSLLKALENFDSLNDLSKFRSWFFKIITRVFYSSVRRHFWKKFIPLDEIRIDMPEVYPRTEFNENRMILDEALSKLSSKQRTAILLFEIAGFTTEEIKSIQNEKSVSAVKSRLSRARQKLKQHINGLETKNVLRTNGNSSRKYFAGSQSAGGDLENETIKLVAELGTKK